MMRVSVVIPAYNSMSLLADAIESTLGQPIDDLELLIVDDGSSDGTTAIIRTLVERDVRVKLIVRSVNGGPAAARNSGLAASSGDLVAFLDADDRWTDDGLALLYRHMIATPLAVVVQGRFLDLWLQPDGVWSAAGAPRYANRLPSALYRRHLFDAIGQFDESLRSGEDLDFWIRMRHRGIAVARTLAVVSYYCRKPDKGENRRALYYRSMARTLKRNLDQHQR